MVEGRSPDTDLLWQARMSTQAPEIDGVVLINDCEGLPPRAGQMRKLRITETHDYDIIGTLSRIRKTRRPARSLSRRQSSFSAGEPVFDYSMKCPIS